MNIFYLHPDPVVNARMHLDKHVVKMILEYAQLLSTAHRVLDGTEYTELTASNRNIKRWKLADTKMESALYKATHKNHPSAVWARQSEANYQHLFTLFTKLCEEYTYRYGKTHKSEALKEFLQYTPKNISKAKFTEPTPAMPDDFKVDGDSIQSYRNYYNGSKNGMFSWKKREVPEWVVVS